MVIYIKKIITFNLHLGLIVIQKNNAGKFSCRHYYDSGLGIRVRFLVILSAAAATVLLLK